ncbi:MAG: hypothetical protein HQL40_13090 [Alphaproteobacteria bacterium]|nr:hypothetical protein [Alphaproteobacteria bacterium]
MNKSDRSLATVDFNGATLLVKRGATPATTMVVMKPVVEGMGLDWEKQREKLASHPVLNSAPTLTGVQMPGDDQTREVVVLPLTRLNFWLATITPTRVPDLAIRARIIRYQTECADVLFDHFFSKAAATLAPGATSELRNRLRAERRQFCEATGTPRRTSYRMIKERYGVASLDDLDEAQLGHAIRWLKALRLTRLEAEPAPMAAPAKGMVTLQVTVTPDQARRILAVLES